MCKIPPIRINACVHIEITQETNYIIFKRCACCPWKVFCSEASCRQNWVGRTQQQFNNCTCFAALHCDTFWKVPYLSPVSPLLMFLTDWASEVCFCRALNLMEYEFSWSVKDLSCNYHRMNAAFQNPFSNWLVGISIVILPYSCLNPPWSMYVIASHFFIILVCVTGFFIHIRYFKFTNFGEYFQKVKCTASTEML